ncbi:SusC/RagA family TonB-linked outer membrane protein [Sinomicrobium weinanense]|uniref:SusC/RagA family TonB-linked outer membrane protein n=1 Tax=Sinomicrobium weinanense TaxID=2842200 RepID=A0A926JU14_9FLAO|nr:SusC/RagA family TonB-linked outer membrane protein [Sinomicrobium weinanense]MBC9797181.1 SusC/RagA family TonB-linked outer membrane protein [Sinomicrobium weinanense]MBU3125843.1 SusC/RagA family TonB-linked outer membrane protein [Sinomicrobium weinanense]
MIIFLMSGWFTMSYGQQGPDMAKHIRAVVVNDKEAPVPRAKVTLGHGNIQVYTDDSGAFSLMVRTDNVLIISANGFKEKVIDLSQSGLPDRIMLESEGLYGSDMIDLPASLQTTQREFVGATDKIAGKDLESQPDMVFSNTLQGRLAGLTARMTTDGPGNNNAELYVRGLSRQTDNQAITVVDGIERPIDFLNPQEIESVEVLKDVNAKILYGPRAANGVVLITTKKGKENTRIFEVSAEYGVNMNTRMAEYLNSAEYARLYNEARANDGLSSFYTQQQIQGYEQSTGANDLLYPDVDYNDYFIEDLNPFRRVNLEYSGGEKGVRYALLAGYRGNQGIEKVGKAVEQDRFNVRGNLSIDLSRSITAHLGANGIIESRKWGKLHQGDFYSALKTQRPNEFPFVITDPDFMGEETPLGEEQIPPLGGSLLNPQSLYGDVVYGGYQEHQFFYGQTNFGLDFDLGNLLKGLSVSAEVTFDNYQYHRAQQINNPVRYAVRAVTPDSLVYTKLNNRLIGGNRSESGNDIERNLGWSAKANYRVTVNNDNHLSLTLSHFYYLNDQKNNRQHTENTNTFLKSTYAYKDRVYIDWVQSVMGSNRFARKNRYKYFSTFGVAWVLSEEEFLKGAKNLDYLKVKGTYGMMGYDRATGFYLYNTRFSNGGNVNFGERNQQGVGRTIYNNLGNPDLKWETSAELNLGVEGLFFNRSLAVEVNYFNEVRDDIIFNSPSSIYSSTFNPYAPHNLGKVVNNGIDGKVTYYGGSGRLRYEVGANVLYARNRVVRADAIDNSDAYLNVEGNPSDAIFGYVSNGLFRSEEAVAEAPYQALGPYKAGNISYQNLNNDGIVNEQDRKVIGNSFPRTSIGINANLKYKGFGLSLLGTSELGVDFMRNNTYYRNSGEGKYSVLARDRFHPVNNPGGNLPALTTYNPTNDFQGSTFWIQDASFFRLKNVEVSYTFSNDTRVARNITVYLRGTNLFVLSGEKDLDPEVPASGVDNYPLMRVITGGLTIGF